LSLLLAENRININFRIQQSIGCIGNVDGKPFSAKPDSCRHKHQDQTRHEDAFMQWQLIVFADDRFSPETVSENSQERIEDKNTREQRERQQNKIAVLNGPFRDKDFA